MMMGVVFLYFHYSSVFEIKNMGHVYSSDTHKSEDTQDYNL